MKTSSGQTQIQQKAASPTSETAQEKKALSETLEFEDQRESSRAQADLQMSIDQSPRMTAQRKKIASAFGPEVQRKTVSPFPQIQRKNSQNTVQREPAVNTSSSSVIQRDLGDEPLVAILESNGVKAEGAYDLLDRQVEVGNNQVDLLEGITKQIEALDDETLISAQNEVYRVIGKFKTEISGLPAKVSAAKEKAAKIGATANVLWEHSHLATLAEDSCLALAKIKSALSKAGGALVKIKEEAVKLAQKAMEAGEIRMMQGLLKVADDSHAEATRGDSVIVNLNSDDAAKSSKKEKIGSVVGHLDSANNVVTGVGFSAISIVDIAMGTAFVLSGVAALALGVIGGVLGVVFGTIGIFLGLKSAYRGWQKKKALKAAKGKLSNLNDLEEIADYAIEQKGQKQKRGGVAAAGGAVALTAGVLGLVALSVATFGLAALVIGLAAALIGLGMIGYRLIHSWIKRKAERKAFADELIAQVREKGADAAGAEKMIIKAGMKPGDVETPGFRKKLSKNVKGLVKSKREQMATDLVSHLTQGKPSEIFDAGIILGALGMDIAKIHQQVNSGQSNKAVSKVAGKMASW